MLYRRGKKGIWCYTFEFGGKRVHESSKSTSKTVAREAERSRRRQLEQSWNQITKRTLLPSFERAALDAIAQAPNPAILGAGSHQIPHQFAESENRRAANLQN